MELRSVGIDPMPGSETRSTRRRTGGRRPRRTSPCNIRGGVSRLVRSDTGAVFIDTAAIELEVS